MKLQSYVGGKWRSGDGQGVLMRDASTGEVVAEADSAGSCRPQCRDILATRCANLLEEHRRACQWINVRAQPTRFVLS
jgi:hypothetical protein